MQHSSSLTLPRLFQDLTISKKKKGIERDPPNIEVKFGFSIRTIEV